ncbi:MAG TPA: hypothetical protein VNF99_15025 [Stellaceae bacterium]|nr:hypothetical protein [Stellaceae bacterium]
MKFYRCYLLSRANAIKDVAEFQSRDDGAAIEHARAIVTAQTLYPGFELWEGARRIHCEPDNRADAIGAGSAE